MVSLGPSAVCFMRLQCCCMGSALSLSASQFPGMGPAHSDLFPPMSLLEPSNIFSACARCSSMGPAYSELFPPAALLAPSILSARVPMPLCVPCKFRIIFTHGIAWDQHPLGGSPRCSRMSPTRCELFSPMALVTPSIILVVFPDALVWAQHAQEPFY
jgi:hypothetical protein